MGELDSSKTRVGPVFTRLLMRDPSGAEWLPELLRLPQRFDGVEVELPVRLGRIAKCAWYPEERQLRAPPSLLRKLVEEPALLSRAGLESSSPKVRQMREKLLAGDAATKRQALTLLASSKGGRAWYVLEGPTSADAYIESENVIVLIEGKRTERGPTTHTTWMTVRHQVLRNLDAAWDNAGKKPVYGFFIVEAEPQSEEVPSPWRVFSNETVSSPALDASLPHCTPEERHDIARSFLGVTTWQSVCSAFRIPFEKLG